MSKQFAHDGKINTSSITPRITISAMSPFRGIRKGHFMTTQQNQNQPDQKQQGDQNRKSGQQSQAPSPDNKQPDQKTPDQK